MTKLKRKENKMKIGIVGFRSADFDDEVKAREVVSIAFDELNTMDDVIEIVSGLTNLGIPAIAYDEASKRGFVTHGIACAKAKDYECFDCDHIKIVGENWGDESATFLSTIDVLFKFGGGKQSEAEFASFSGAKEEFDIN